MTRAPEPVGDRSSRHSPSLVAGTHPDAEFRPAQPPLGVIGQRQAIGEGGQEACLRQVVVDDREDSFQRWVLGLDRQEPRLLTGREPV